MASSNPMKKTLIIGADHAGFKLKNALCEFLRHKKYIVHDVGDFILNKNDDYPLYGLSVAQQVIKTKNSFGILLCGSSTGVCITANKIKGIRAVAAADITTAKLARSHTDANVLCLSGWKLTGKKAQPIIHAFLTTPFSNETRHKRRIKQIEEIEHTQ